MKNTMIKIAAIYVDYFNEHGEEKTYKLLEAYSVVSVLYFLYNTFVIEGIEKIEEISEEKKRQYYNVGCQYYQSRERIIKASKAAYVLALITSNH